MDGVKGKVGGGGGGGGWLLGVGGGEGQAQGGEGAAGTGVHRRLALGPNVALVAFVALGALRTCTVDASRHM